MFEDVRRLTKLLNGSSPSDAAVAEPDTASGDKGLPDNAGGGVSGSGPATNFRNAATDGVGVWGPIMGGIVAIGGSVAIVGSLLAEKPSTLSS